MLPLNKRAAFGILPALLLALTPVLYSITSNIARADETVSDVELATVSSDALRPGQSYSYRATLNAAGDLTGMRKTSAVEATENYSLADIKSSQVPLILIEGRPVITLTGPALQAHDGGHVTMTFVRNAITGRTGTFEFDVVRENGRWTLYAVYDGARKSFNALFLRKKDVGGQTVGVDAIVPSQR